MEELTTWTEVLHDCQMDVYMRDPAMTWTRPQHEADLANRVH